MNHSYTGIPISPITQNEQSNVIVESYALYKGREGDTKHLIGFFITYIIVLYAVPYYLYYYAHNTLFLTYFANVDIVCNILAINFPSYFKHIYNIDPNNPTQYISYNVISLIALSGIFIHGLSLKNTNNHSDISIFLSMVIMSIVTWTLPTQLIPYLTKQVKQYLKIKETDKTKDVLITTIISLVFIVGEGILIHLLIDDNRLLKNNKYIQNIEFDF